MADRLLTANEAAERLGTGVRFVRRLIQERRIRYVKLGKPVRIPESAVAAKIEERLVPTLREAQARTRRARPTMRGPDDKEAPGRWPGAF